MGTVDNCYDNSMMESFSGTMQIAGNRHLAAGAEAEDHMGDNSTEQGERFRRTVPIAGYSDGPSA